MNTFLKRATPLVLLLMAVLVFCEHLLPGSPTIHRMVGSDGVLRFVVGVLCIYVMLLVIERQSLDARFTQVLQTFKQFYAARAGAAASEPPSEARMEQAKREALPILLAALESPDPTVRETALDNLRRLTGKDLGTDAGAWRQHLERPEEGD
jgi:HEAT repeat